MPTYLQKKITRVQSVVKFFEDPCQAPWSVYFELALTPAGKVVIELLAFGFDDVVRGYFRPRGIYRRTRGGRLARKFGKFLGIPEIGEMIGSHLPGAHTIKGRVVSNGVRFMWLVDGVLQRAMFWWMIADLLTDFLYEWTSAIAKTEYCRRQSLSGAIACDAQPNTIPPMHLSPNGVIIGCEFLHKRWGTLGTGSPYLTLAPYTFFAASLTMIPFIGPDPGGLNVWIAPAGEPDVRMSGGDFAAFDPLTQSATAVATGAAGKPGLYVVRANCGGPDIGLVTGGILFGFGYG